LLGIWRNHKEYQAFVLQTYSEMKAENLESISEYENIISKLFLLNLDPLKDLIFPLYSNEGAPANQQPEIFRSFILMNHLGIGITGMVKKLVNNKALRTAIGVDLGNVPSIGSHYNFIDRIIRMDESSILKPVYRKPSKKYGKNVKMPSKHPDIVAKLVGKILEGESFDKRPEKLLQQIFAECIVKPSAKLGLLGDTKNLDISGDGTCVKSGASHHGKKVCDCKKNGIYNCKCSRKFSDPNATWGWDSYNEKYFYGYMGYFVCCHNKNKKLDLPIYLRFLEGRRHDSVSTVVALAELPNLYPDFAFSSFACDSAADNYATYELLHKRNINAVIALNTTNKGNFVYPEHLSIDRNGVPVCPNGNKMINWGFNKERCRIKWRCPLACKKLDSCPNKCNCSPSNYGRVIYTKPSWDLRLFTSFPRGSSLWKEKMNARTSCERINNRILHNYHIEASKLRGKKRISFFTTVAAFNVHLDAHTKYMNFSIVDYLLSQNAA